MTSAQLEKLATRIGGPIALARRLGVGKDWVYRRISGETPIQQVDELAIRQAMKESYV